jgi:hypothetical protein
MSPFGHLNKHAPHKTRTVQTLDMLQWAIWNEHARELGHVEV